MCVYEQLNMSYHDPGLEITGLEVSHASSDDPGGSMDIDEASIRKRRISDENQDRNTRKKWIMKTGQNQLEIKKL